ncbi:hypothetical protein B7P43_G12131 [Cryptotermes secundus]|uniref:Uncharacterized protein n=1 Tax=Cryptotermes secundus TaxID=105785 RepID=A0A2J7R2D8_9NEOP|nr:hypothetical protein B7P43_G12131 [Cryptotermes secundus]
MVETALFYRMQTDRTSKTLQESRSHNRPYILLSQTNLTVIGKSAKPRCF